MTCPVKALGTVCLWFCLLVCLLVLPAVAAAQEVVFVVRHAERADQSSDSLLSAPGEARAAHLASLLKDSGITRIFTSELKRTIQTAAPLAEALGLTPARLAPDNYEGLFAQVRASAPRDRVLIVGHSNTLPEILKRLGIAEPITIADQEYDNLFIVTSREGAAPSLVRLRF